LEVLRYSEKIMEDTGDGDHDILVAVALLHDIGIRQSEEILGYNNGKTQEKYGPPAAEELLRDIGFPPDKIVKVCEIIGNHHSPSRYDYAELRIIKEAGLAEALQRTAESHSRELEKRLEKQQITAEEKEIVLRRIHLTTNMEEGASKADLAIEAVPEGLEIKREVFAQLDEVCPRHTILATNSFIASRLGYRRCHPPPG
jgi:HD superfamily phosphodiesterase